MIGLSVFQKFYSAHSALTIFDIGAHCGDSVNEFLALFPMSRVFAFEPDKDNCKRLKDRFGHDLRVQIFNTAVGQEDGCVALHRNNYDATHSLLPINAREVNRWGDVSDFCEVEIVQVRQIKLDTFCSKRCISRIDILKLDTQGGEMMAFRGAEKTLTTQSISCIFCEVELRELYEHQPLFWDINEYLTTYSYHFMNIVNPKVTELGVLSWADAIYVNDQLWEKIASKHSGGAVIGKSRALKRAWEKESSSLLSANLEWMVQEDGARIKRSNTLISVVTPSKAWSYAAVGAITVQEPLVIQRGIIRVLVSATKASAGIGFIGCDGSDFIKRTEVRPSHEPQEIYFEFDNLSEARNVVIQTWAEDNSAEVDLFEFSVREMPHPGYIGEE